MLRSFNGLEPGGLELTDKKVKERKRLIFLGLHRKPIKPLHRTCSVHRGHRCPLDGRRHRAPSREGLRSPGRKVNSEGLCAPGNQPERERKERMTRGGQASVSEAHHFIFRVGFYTLSCTLSKVKNAESCRISSTFHQF